MNLSTFVSYVKTQGLDTAVLYAQCCDIPQNIITHWVNVAKAS